MIRRDSRTLLPDNEYVLGAPGIFGDSFSTPHLREALLRHRSPLLPAGDVFLGAGISLSRALIYSTVVLNDNSFPPSHRKCSAAIRARPHFHIKFERSRRLPYQRQNARRLLFCLLFPSYPRQTNWSLSNYFDEGDGIRWEPSVGN